MKNLLASSLQEPRKRSFCSIILLRFHHVDWAMPWAPCACASLDSYPDMHVHVIAAGCDVLLTTPSFAHAHVLYEQESELTEWFTKDVSGVEQRPLWVLQRLQHL